MASTRREKELARQRAERQAARRAEAAARRKRRQAVVAGATAAAVVLVALVALVLVNRSGDDDTVAAPPPVAAPSPGACDYRTSSEPAARQAPTPSTQDTEARALTATLSTNLGPIVLALDAAAAPCTVNSFVSLTEATFYDDTPCHRLTTSGISVLQCGDPTGTGRGGPGYQYDGENLQGATYPRGTVAMANAGPGTNGSQFFLVYGDSELPPDYTPFGTITSGLEVLDEVAGGGSQPPGDGRPVLPVQITGVSVTPTT